jgi:hypothetical protein
MKSFSFPVCAGKTEKAAAKIRLMQTLQALRERRAYECRLTPDRALETVEEAAAWVLERGMVTITEDCALPSLFAACHEEPYKPGAKGFGSWPKTKYWWSLALSRHPELVQLRIHRGKALLMSREVAALADPLCRDELGRLQGDGKRLVDHLAQAGPSLVEEIREELGFNAASLRRVRGRAERVGAVVSREVVLEQPHRHTSELRRWDQLFPRAVSGGIAQLAAAGVRAAVVAPEAEVKRWFTWTVDPCALALERPEPGWVAAPASG